MCIRDREKKESEQAQDRDTTTVNGMIESLKEINCKFCRGWGHKAKQCCTLKSLNGMTSKAPGLKQAWGKIKSDYLTKAFVDITFKSQLKR